MKKRYMAISAAIFVICLLLISGCAKKTDVTSMPKDAPGSATGNQQETKKDSAFETQDENAVLEGSASGGSGLRSVYYDYDQSALRDEARKEMMANAKWLKANPKAKVRIEGNCDEHGTREYNQALGQRRSESAKRYLTDLGISSGRISLISYGKERPICTDNVEECWLRNRRADFIAVNGD